MSLARTGHPRAIASSGGKPNPSYSEGKTKAVAPAYSRAMSASVGSATTWTRCGARVARSVRSIASMSSSGLPARTRSTGTSACWYARTRNGTFLLAVKLPTKSRYGRSNTRRLPSALSARGGAGALPRPGPEWMTTTRCGSTPKWPNRLRLCELGHGDDRARARKAPRIQPALVPASQRREVRRDRSHE